jgi:hypothetical protein
MVELVDTQRSGRCARKGVRVRFPFPAPDPHSGDVRIVGSSLPGFGEVADATNAATEVRVPKWDSGHRADEPKICRMVEIETALFIAFLVVVFAVMIGIGWYGTTGGRGAY